MKTRNRSFWLVLLVLALLLMVAVPVVAKTTTTPYTSIQIPNYFERWDFGTWTYPGNNVHVRGFFQVFDLESSDPRTDGIGEATINGNWDSDFSGPMWGTNCLEVDADQDGVMDGVWEGTWTGYQGAAGEESFIRNHVLHGVSGSVEGLKLKASIVFPADGSPSTVTGEIYEHDN